jgi:hypothetical protein
MYLHSNKLKKLQQSSVVTVGYICNCVFRFVQLIAIASQSGQEATQLMWCAAAWRTSSCHLVSAQCSAFSYTPSWLIWVCLSNKAHGWLCCRSKNLAQPPAMFRTRCQNETWKHQKLQIKFDKIKIVSTKYQRIRYGQNWLNTY